MTRSDRHSGPSFRLRAAIAVTLLVSFYLLMIGTALLLAAVPIFVIMQSGRFHLSLFLFWFASSLLLGGTALAGAPPEKPHGRRLTPDEAPRLFDLLHKIALRSGVDAPDQVYLSALPNASVTQTGGLLRRGSRILVLGLPMLDTLTIPELRAVLAHEYGHFAGGDTRLLRLASHAHDLFASTLSMAKASPFAETPRGILGFALLVGHGLAWTITQVYAKLYFRLSLGMSRSQELAADRLAASVAGRDAMISALERTSRLDAYSIYLETDVAMATKRGVMPTDLLAGFEVFCERFFQSAVGQALMARRLSEMTNPYDSHPSLSDRIRALRALPEGGHDSDADRPYRDVEVERAIQLLSDPADMEEWHSFETQSTVAHISGLRRLPWAEIASRIYAEEMRETARRTAAELHPVFPAALSLAAMFVSVVRAMEEGKSEAVATTLEPAIAALPASAVPQAIGAVARAALLTLFGGALMERGGTVDPALGAVDEGRPQLMFEGTRLDVISLTEKAMVDARARAEMIRWAERLSAPPSGTPPRS